MPAAGWHLHSALVISRENGNQRNQALALANLGCLALDVGASWVAERFLVRSSIFLTVCFQDCTIERKVEIEIAYTYLL